MRKIPDYKTLKHRLEQLEEEEDKFRNNGKSYEASEYTDVEDLQVYYPEIEQSEKGFVSDWQTLRY